MNNGKKIIWFEFSEIVEVRHIELVFKIFIVFSHLNTINVMCCMYLVRSVHHNRCLLLYSTVNDLMCLCVCVCVYINGYIKYKVYFTWNNNNRIFFGFFLCVCVKLNFM